MKIEKTTSTKHRDNYNVIFEGEDFVRYEFYYCKDTGYFCGIHTNEEYRFSSAFALLVALHYEIHGLSANETFDELFEFFHDNYYDELLFTVS